MAQVNFNYNGTRTTIQCNLEDSMEMIIHKFLTKFNQNLSIELYFLYDGKVLDNKLSFKEAANDTDKSRKIMNILVNEKQAEQNKISSMTKSKYIICPQCKENTFISIKDYLITLKNCKNGHEINNILFNEFEGTQMIDQSTIICEVCKTMKKSETYQNAFYFCCSCNKFLCPLCKNSHSKEHHFIDYNKKDFICNKHYESYISYCNKCKKDICVLCLKEHNGHEIINYGDIIPDVNILEQELNKLKKIIMDYKSYINAIILKFNKLIESLDDYYKIYNDIIKNFDIKQRNYNIIMNINNLYNYNDDFIQILGQIAKNENIKEALNDIMLMYYKIFMKCNDYESLIEKSNAIDNLKKTKKSFSSKDRIDQIYLLNDGRILTCKNNGPACVYNLNNDVVICDISSNELPFGNIIQMEDNNIINFANNELKVIKIKKHSFEEIQTIKIFNSIEYKKILKISNEKICIYLYEFFKIYLYQNGKLVDIQKEFQVPLKNYFVNGEPFIEYCVINQNEIASLYLKDGKIYGLNAFLIFYDMEKFKEIKTLQLGDGAYGSGEVCLLNENYIVAETTKSLVIINIKSRKVIKEIKTDFHGISLFQLSKNLICLCDRKQINLYLFENVNDYEIYNKIWQKVSIQVCKSNNKEKLVIVKDGCDVKIYENYLNYFDR